MYRLAVSAGGSRGDLDPRRFQEDMRAADEGGVDSVWIGESWGPDAITLLALAAAYTSRVRLGSSIVNVFSRTPAALAQHFATLDVVSGGRMILGLGTSGKNVVEHFHGIPFGRGLRRLREYIDVINTLVAGEPLNYEGEIFTVNRGFRLQFATARPHIPIFIASLTPASVRLTARRADGWLPIYIPVDRLADEIATLRGIAAAAGRDPAALTVRSPGGIVLTKDVERATAATRGTIAFYVARMGVSYYNHLARLLGDETVAPIKRAFDEGGSAAGAAAVSDTLAQSMTFATDSVEAARERLAQQQAAGVDLHTVAVQADSARERSALFEALAR